VIVGAVIVNEDVTERVRAQEAIRKSERVLREAEELGHTGSWEQDLVTGKTFNSEANLRLFFGDDRSKGASFEDFIQAMHPDDREYVLQRRAQLIAEGQLSDTEFRVVWPDGSIHVIHRRAIVDHDESGKAIRLYGTNVDITERKQAEQEMKRQAARAETLARIAAGLNKQLDLEAVIHAVCQEAVDTFKVSQAIISLYDKKRDLLDYAGGVNIPPRYGAKMEPVSRAQFEESVRTMGPILVVPDVQARPNVPSPEFTFELNVRTVVSADMRRDQELIGVLVLGVNGQVREFDPDELSLLKAISDQAAIAIANAQLLKTANEQRQQLRNLSARLLDVQEAERRALTTELHDRVGQNLTGLSINLQNLKASLSQEVAQELAAKFDDAQTLVEDTSRQIRDIMAELHLPELEDYGLAAALETYAERAASRGSLELIADLPDLDRPHLPSDVRATLFRAAQEAISNVLKHANATQLKVSLEGQNGRVRLKIEDNGQGFDPDPISQKERQTWGLQIMQERIESIGGTVQIESQPGQGTRVIFDVERPS
jgi:signal transduction histidine kinase